MKVVICIFNLILHHLNIIINVSLRYILCCSVFNLVLALDHLHVLNLFLVVINMGLMVFNLMLMIL